MAVSKVLHGKGATVRVSKDKADHIRRIAEQLRYQPNHLARSFRSKRTYTVGLVFEHFQKIGDRTGYFSMLLNGVMSATFPGDFSLTICPKLIRNSSTGAIFDGRFDGIVWCKPDLSQETREAIQNAPVPIVALHVTPQDIPGVPTFCCDNQQALRLAVQHLKQLGHRKLAFAIDRDNRESVEALARISAFFAAMGEAGLPCSPSDLLVWDHDGQDLEAYWNGDDRHTGLICFSESHAVSLLKSAEQFGISVPGDLSIIGYDSTSFCETTTPRLTAIAQPVEQMAFEATQYLISAIEGEPSPLHHFIYPCALDIRESTARPASHSRGDSAL
jgi:DNA-binding LacI/PurR family transcriptional regulator